MSYVSEAEIENLVRAFEACEIKKDEFKHREHLAVAVWYVQTLGRKAALERMRTELIRFLDHHGVDRKKYSETITEFWIEKIAEELNALGEKVSFLESCNEVVAALQNRAR